MKITDIRQTFMDFFASKGHKVEPSAPMVVKNDPTLMFTNAGMNQFKDLFLGTHELILFKVLKIWGVWSISRFTIFAGFPATMEFLGTSLVTTELDATIEKVTDMKDILSYGVMSTPALVVDEKVVSTGKVLSPKDIIKLIG